MGLWEKPRSVRQRKARAVRKEVYIWLVGVMGARWHGGLTDSATFWVVWCQNEMTHASALPRNPATSAWSDVKPMVGEQVALFARNNG